MCSCPYSLEEFFFCFYESIYVKIYAFFVLIFSSLCFVLCPVPKIRSRKKTEEIVLKRKNGETTNNHIIFVNFLADQDPWI